jgi:hypothetical protein
MLFHKWKRRWLYSCAVGVALTGAGAAQTVLQVSPPPPPGGAAILQMLPPPGLPPVAGPLERPAESKPGLLERPVESKPEAPAEPPPPPEEDLLQTPMDPPLGFTGPSGVEPTEYQESSHFVPIEDRWRVGFPEWDRYGTGPQVGHDVPYELGRAINPFNQNVLKGDYPIIGQNTFLNITATDRSIFDVRQVPTGQNGFESTSNPGGANQFGKPNQFFYQNLLSVSFDLNHGDSAFKPTDWRIKVTPVFDINYLSVEEVGIVNPDVRKGTTRGRTFLALEEWFVETKIADISPDYDFVSARVGSQFFNSDFRGFLFTDTNLAARLFGNYQANRDQFNVIVFQQREKDTDSQLNTFNSRDQTVLIANFFRQDFFVPGYTATFSVHYNNDRPSFHFDRDNFLVRPDPVGLAAQHELNVMYLGWGGDGHIGRVNIDHQFYWAYGRDSLNPLANQAVDINAQMAAVELSYSRDYVRFRTSFFWSSGDDNINNSHATGFDAIIDNPNFVGGEFSYWQRQPIKLLGVFLKQENSLIPDLRSSKTEGQSNFVNPGVLIGNAGVDVDLTPKLKWINNWNLLWFDETNPLEQFVFQEKVHHFIGADLSTGMEYRPLLSNNIVTKFGVSTLLPGRGFKDLYNNANSETNPMVAGFLEVILQY